MLVKESVAKTLQVNLVYRFSLVLPRGKDIFQLPNLCPLVNMITRMWSREAVWTAQEINPIKPEE